jgi:hypothetical protein
MAAMEDFIRWALDPVRTVEQRYVIELLVEDAVPAYHSRRRNFSYYQGHYERRRVRERQRELNPAYEPRYSADDLEKAAEVLAEQKEWRPSHTAKRPIRDVSVFPWLPMLESLDIGGEVTDLAPLAEIPLLKKLSFASSCCEDYRPLARCAGLRELFLGLGVHWPEVGGLEALDALEVLSLSGNLLVFERGIAWPRVRRGSLHCSPLAARSVADLPCFPACELLTLDGAERLDGIEAFPLVRNLTLSGPVRDFAPLQALGALTALHYTGERPRDLRPLASLERLEFLHLHAPPSFTRPEAPRDHMPLTEAPALRELIVTGCPPVEMEVAAINAGLPSWNDRLLAPNPPTVPLPPLRIVLAPWGLHPGNKGGFESPKPAAADPMVDAREWEWRRAFLHAELSPIVNDLTGAGGEDWGEAWANVSSRAMGFTIHDYSLMAHFPALLDAARGILRRLRGIGELHFSIALKVPPPEMTSAQAALKKQFEDEQDEASFQQYQRDREEYLERLHRLEMMREEGGEIDPKAFEAPAPAPPPEAPWERESPEEEDAEGGVVFQKPPEPPPCYWDDEHPLARNYNLSGTLTMDAAWFITHARGEMMRLMGREPDEEIEPPRTGP